MRNLRPAPTRESSIRAAGAAIVAILMMTAQVQAETPHDGLVYQTQDLKIFRAISSRGRPVMILTNLDEEGNRLSSPTDTERLMPPRCTDAPGGESTDSTSSAPASGAPEDTSSGPVKVVINQGDRESPVDARDVEVTQSGTGGTTVIINVNPPAPPARETTVVPASYTYPVVSIGGLVGGYRYPDHQHFLGYGHGTSSPSWFGGLGLNAGNGFGLKNGTPCDKGFDCMFGPPSPHP